MSTVEERVTRMVFDTSKFSGPLQQVLTQLTQLKDALKLDGASKGIQNVADSASKFSMAGMKDQVSGVMGQFGALQVAAITALSNIVNRAVDAGVQIAKSLTLQPVTAGFREYETQLNAVQTIMANTGLKGAEGLGKVSAKLDELNTYSDQTIYNFTEMAKNIGTFTAAGVDLDKSTAAIKGIANLAAISGSNSQQASTAMYQLSQALSSGKVSLEDWNSVVNAGMGGKIFRDSLIETARVHGVNIDAIIKKQGSFRNSIQEGWITTDILSETLAKFTGDLSEAQLESLGYTKEQAKGIMEMGQTATDAATKVKTMTQLLDTLREAATSGWAQTWKIIFGDFDEARGMFTDVSNYLGGAINDFSDARNELLQGWKDLGGRDALIDGIRAAFEALLSVIRPIGQAFREMFPAVTAQNLYDLTVSFRNFMERLKIGEETANNLRRTFAGLFAVIGIGVDFVKALIGFVGNLIGRLTGAGGGVLRFTGNIGDFLVALRKFLQEGKAFEKFFQVLETVIGAVIKIVSNFAQVIGKIWDKADPGPVEDMLRRVTMAAKPVLSVGDMIQAVWERVTRFISAGANAVYEGLMKVVDWVRKVAGEISKAFGGGDGVSSESIFKGLNTATLIAFVTMLWNFFRNFNPGEFLESITDSIEALTGALRGMQFALSGAALLSIAAAIGILALSMEKLSKIDAMGLTRASTAIAVLMGEMAAAFILFDKVGGTLGAAKLIVVSTALIRLGAALLILVTAVEKLAKIDWDDLAKGLLGVLVLTGTLVAGVKFLPTDIAGIVKTATALLILTVAIRNLVNAVEDLGKLSWEELARGLTGVAALLVALGLFTKIADLNKGGIAAGIGIILIATALEIMADAVGKFVQYNWEQLARGMAGIAAGIVIIAAALAVLPPTSIFSAGGVLIVASSLHLIAKAVGEMGKFSWGEIGRGLTTLAGSLAAIALAIGLMPPTSILSAVGVMIVAASLGMIVDALGDMSKMTWEEIGKGLVVLAGALFIIAGALFFIQGAVGGAVAVLIVAAALRVLLPVLQAFGAMSWEQIVKGLVGLAGVFIILGAAGVVLGPFVGVIIGLAGGIALLGLAVLAAGVGVLAFATGLGILATVGVGATAVLVGIVTAMMALLPQMAEALGEAIIAFAKVMTKSGEAVTEFFTAMLISLMDALIKLTPVILELLLTLIIGLIKLFEAYVPQLVDSGAKIIIAILEGMGKHVNKIVTTATDLLVKFIEAIGQNLHRVNEAGAKMVIDFVNGTAESIRTNSAKMGEAGVNLATALIEGVLRGMAAGVGRAAASAAQMGRDMINSAMSALGINSPSKEFMKIGAGVPEGTEIGVDKNAYLAEDAVVRMGDGMMDKMSTVLDGLSKVLGSDMIDFDPTITPVLDLSDIKRNAGELISLLSVPTLDLTSSYQKAQEANASYEQNRTDDGAPEPHAGGNSYTYNQYNTSPKALGAAEIYRNTKNLISIHKEVANAPTA